MLNGKKTYLIAATSAFGAITAGLTGQMAWPEVAAFVTQALMAATIRHGVAQK
jgi:hypothetical protein